jgi:predicted RNA-binding Zn-ribbon protein involved in translation (DUF1610 family)
MSDLQIVAKARDLPPRWDGHRVEWRPWTSLRTTMRLHSKPEPCPSCGSTADQASSAGTLHPLLGEMVEVTRMKRTKRSGREYSVRAQRPATAYLALFAYRCPDCGLDTVWDTRTDEWWELGPEDYGPDGSHDPRLPL